MSKGDQKKGKKHREAVMQTLALKVLNDAPVMREALIAAIEAGAAAAIAIFRQATDSELTKSADSVGAKPEKKFKKKTAEPETKPTVTAA